MANSANHKTQQLNNTNLNNNEINAKVGRPAAEGRRHQYVVADDVHQWIFEHGGSKYLTDTIRAIMAVSPCKQEGTTKSERQRVNDKECGRMSQL